MNTHNLKIILIFILLFLIIILTGTLIFALNNKSFNFSFFKFEKEELIKTDSFDINSINAIDINTIHDVRFITTDEKEIEVKIFGSKNDKVDINLNNNILKINYNHHKVCFGFCFFNNYIEVHIPKNYNKDIDINTISGNIELDTFMASKLNLQTTSGEIKLGVFNKVNAVSVSGDIDIESVNIAEIKTTSGDININSINDSFELITTSGNIDINNIVLKKNSKIKTVSGDVVIKKKNDIYIESNTTSGDINIKNNNRLAETILNIKTVSGNINSD